jgi:hypothetical protein
VTTARKKVTITLPVEVLRNAQRITGKGITPTILEGLEELQRREQRSALRRLRGKIRFELDVEETRR